MRTTRGVEGFRPASLGIACRLSMRGSFVNKGEGWLPVRSPVGASRKASGTSTLPEQDPSMRLKGRLPEHGA